MSHAIESIPLSSTVSWQQQGDVAVLWLDNPPVNGLGDTTRAGLHAGITRALQDATVAGVVLAGAGKAFCGGADIRQFNTPAATARPLSRDVLALIESASKPVVAAIHGVALGGGLELAMGCHYRVVASDASLGLPEVNLGLVPGGGGTQRLPRLVGVEQALDMIQQGVPVSGETAARIGLADAVADASPSGTRDAGPVVALAVDFCRRAAARAVAHPVASALAVKAGGDVDFGTRIAAINGKARNAIAQNACIRCVEAATQLPIADGLAFERAQFEALVAGNESKALRHIFFAEREAPKFAEGKGQALRPIERVAVIGSGTMGVGIAMSFVNAGIPVMLIEREQAALDRGVALIRRNYEITAAKGKLAPQQIDARMGRITPTLAFEAVADADLVVEAVFEDMAVKQAIFERLDALCKPSAILATNTSRLNIDTIAASTKRPGDVIGLHFFSPANVMKLLEVVRGQATHADVIASCMAMAQRIRKIPVLVRVCEGFVGNRMLTPYWREAGFLLEEGASPLQVDRALTQFGMAMGPLTMADLAGMDINWATRKRLAPTRPAHLRYSAVADRICELGRFGQKTNGGYYRYEPGSRTPIPDPQIDALIEDCAREAGIARRPVADEEIVERCMLALINEGARILDEGIAQRASDIDVVYVHGYGFPAWRGGPMFYAETLGLAHVLTRIRALQDVHGAHWEPAPLLERLVAEGRRTFDGPR
ncbi:3-hydroxyacyl-CoA dehydrogenase NAD-binding domain-containing protein [Cupriavidus metallidurans]|uniref:3-hydroxyacyl-CoA dehydrogenase NAD-binding domain-containing protein n=1 Tax=Cupriavidus TaxID=106589 RepID=UPI0002A46A4F|nr:MULTISPECIES: 3-hydroxyacyl-CoA dehydrogenase NAD-binding domain-containing protein [Cupriavidus]ELA00543.1 short chain enoyl-CoA hydratase / 3-hydroxyacyl-CoA dehydrogenase [Cupriavidus sp. HMR-1]GMG94258.1 3-hydroxyacyl-CoA dehydrogenase [Cupriavidus sp. TKC]HBD39484.1 3-hydroxyacyl-CoA dehydrogenase [Cupriavidus sp.]